jgi:hypothetical protein
MVLLHAWQRDERGHLRRRTFDEGEIPAGWYDAPDKVPEPAVPAPTLVPSPAPASAPAGEEAPRRRGRPRKR